MSRVLTQVISRFVGCLLYIFDLDHVNLRLWHFDDGAISFNFETILRWCPKHITTLWTWSHLARSHLEELLLLGHVCFKFVFQKVLFLFKIDLKIGIFG